MLATVGVVLPAKSDVLSVECQQSMVGNSHAMGVPAQIAQHLQRTAKGWLGVDNPVLTMQATKELRELVGISQCGGRTGTMEFLAAIEAFYTSEKFPTKDATEDFHRQEETITRAGPTTTIWR